MLTSQETSQNQLPLNKSIMILTDEFKIDKTENLESSYIENELSKFNISPLRWAIVDVTDTQYVLTVSYEKNVQQK